MRLYLFKSTIAMLALSGAIMTTACSSSKALVNDDLDPLTGVTVTYADAPIVMYRDKSGRAAFARDLIHMGPIQVNRMGRYRYYLWLGIWSTLQTDDVSKQRDGFESVILFVDGEPLQLELEGWTEDAIGASEPIYTKPVATAADAFYEVSIDQVRLLAEASDIRLRTTGASPASYELWDTRQSAKGSIRAFLAEVDF